MVRRGRKERHQIANVLHILQHPKSTYGYNRFKSLSTTNTLALINCAEQELLRIFRKNNIHWGSFDTFIEVHPQFQTTVSGAGAHIVLFHAANGIDLKLYRKGCVLSLSVAMLCVTDLAQGA